MARRKTNETIRVRYFTWTLYRRGRMYYADGRTNKPRLGRHSLESSDRAEALAALEQLDRFQAVEHGLADRSIIDDQDRQSLRLEEGRTLYEQHLTRPEVAGGASLATQKRYRAVLDKFLPYAREQGVRSWNQVTDRVLSEYLGHLKKEGYADRTLTMEGTLIKQIVGWLVSEGMLTEKQRLRTSLAKPRGTTTYCWKPEEVSAMLAHCSASPRLQWLGAILLTLARTGLRIGELLALEWVDIDLVNGILTVVNDSSGCHERRLTKNRESRPIPIHPELLSRLKRLRTSSNGTGRVFKGAEGGRLKADDVRIALVKRVIAPLKERFPIPAGDHGFERGRLHSFRHYFISRAANTGIPVKTLQAWIGHRDSEMIDIYYHLSDKESRRQMSSLNFAAEVLGNDDQGSVA